jgi:hypothetical protein
VIELGGGDKATLGEGPIWDGRDGRLFWVDIVEGVINVLTPATSRSRRIEVGEHVGCVALTARPDTLVGALRSGWYWIDVETGAKQLIAASPAGAGCRFNDGAVDRAGRLWVGTLEDGETNPVGELYVLAPNLSYRPMDRGFLCSNGITWSTDRRCIDSTTKWGAWEIVASTSTQLICPGFRTASKWTAKTRCGARSGTARRSSDLVEMERCGRRLRFRQFDPPA